MATTTVVGNIANDIELRYTQAGKPFCSVTVAVNEKKFNKQTNQYEDGKPWFARGTLWGVMAENVHASVGKASRVIGEGKIIQRDYEDSQGNKRTSVEIDFTAFGPDLRFATAAVTRNERQNNGHQSVGGSNNAGMNGWAQPGANGAQNGFPDSGGFDDQQPF